MTITVAFSPRRKATISVCEEKQTLTIKHAKKIILETEQADDFVWAIVQAVEKIEDYDGPKTRSSEGGLKDVIFSRVEGRYAVRIDSPGEYTLRREDADFFQAKLVELFEEITPKSRLPFKLR